MKMKILMMIAILAALVLGYSIGGHRARGFANNHWAFFVRAEMEFNLRAQEQAAFNAYLHEPPAVAAWALETLIQAYERHAATLLAINGKQGPENRSHEMFAHARLSKVYSRLNSADQAQRHLDRAIGLSQGKDADELMQMVEWADQAEAKTSQAPAPDGAPSAPTGER